MQVKKKALLWMHKTASNREHEIRIRLTLYKEVTYLNTGYTCPVNQWDEQNHFPLPSHPRYKEIAKRIGELLDEIDFEIRLAIRQGNNTLSLTEIKNKVKKPIKKSSQVKILTFYDTVIETLENEGRIGYAKVFKSSKDNFKKFLGPADKGFTQFSKSDFEGYEQFLLANIKEEATISVYLRTFTRLWNIAIEKGNCPKEHHPSKFIRFKAYKRFKTKKRAISADYIRLIENLSFDVTTRLYRSQQYFLFSYFARGINFIDLAKLKHSTNLMGNVLQYTRSKNKRKYQYTLHTKALSIIHVFREYPLQSDTGYIFPILHQIHNTPKKIDARLDSALKDLNEDLCTIAKMIGLQKHLTSYVARHSFATNLRNKNVTISMIQEAMGHETETQTMTYLDDMDDTIVAGRIEEAL